MTEHGTPDTGDVACPFVAFADARSERANRPDHRHRCYADLLPAPRALAHQEAYCLTDGFAICPTFRDWAKRESARALGTAGSLASGPEPTGTADAPVDSADGPASDGVASGGVGSEDPGVDAAGLEAWTGRPAPSDGSLSAGELAPGDALEKALRNPQRDWAAPPPWLGNVGRRDREPVVPGFLVTRGKGSAEDRTADGVGLAGSRWLQGAPDPTEAGDGAPGADDGPVPPGSQQEAAPRSRDAGLSAGLGAGLSAGPDIGLDTPGAAPREPRPRRAGTQSTESSRSIVGSGTATAGPRRRGSAGASVAGTSAAGAPAAGVGLPHLSRRPTDREATGPAWERPRRFEAYPTLKTRMGWPNPPRILIGVLALVVAAVVVFAAPFLWRFAAVPGGTANATPTPTVLATSSIAPTDSPAPTPQTYVVVAKDTMGGIAKKFGLTVDQLLAANKQIKNPDRIAIGDRLVIPPSAPTEIVNGASPSAGPSASP